jgi:predicted RNA-binding Zn ribbon-like protein
VAGLTVNPLRDTEPDGARWGDSKDKACQRVEERFSCDHGYGSGLEFRTMRRWGSPEALLLPIGEALAKFVCEENLSNVKACEGPACTPMFDDHTRGRARRWCSMAICGNRAKQAAHRYRLKMQQ